MICFSSIPYRQLWYTSHNFGLQLSPVPPKKRSHQEMRRNLFLKECSKSSMDRWTTCLANSMTWPDVENGCFIFEAKWILTPHVFVSWVYSSNSTVSKVHVWWKIYSPITWKNLWRFQVWHILWRGFMFRFHADFGFPTLKYLVKW